MGKANKNDDYTAVLLEDINGSVKAILEIVAPMHKDLLELKTRYNEDIPSMMADTVVIKAAAVKTNQNVAKLEGRVTRLEAKTA